MKNFTKTNLLTSVFTLSFFLLLTACKDNVINEIKPNQAPGNFNLVSVSLTSSSSSTQADVNLKWTKSIDPDGDPVTYSVVYKDTLIKNLKDTTFTFKSSSLEILLKGSIIANDTKGGKLVKEFSIQLPELLYYVAIPDVNFEKSLIALKIDDVQDGKVLRKSVSTLTTLNLSGQTKTESDKISSLVGIEAFINLRQLTFSYNLIKSVDISKNTNISTLYCDHNALTELDLSKNKALVFVFCGFNDLTSFDVSNNTALTDLQCGSNSLKKLDITKNTALINLGCSTNQLSELYLTNNINLTGLNCTVNQLTSLDIRKNKPFLVFETRGNNIQTICVSSLSQVQSNWQKDDATVYKVCP